VRSAIGYWSKHLGADKNPSWVFKGAHLKLNHTCGTCANQSFFGAMLRVHYYQANAFKLKPHANITL
jgi:hypothetical protein